MASLSFRTLTNKGLLSPNRRTSIRFRCGTRFLTSEKVTVIVFIQDHMRINFVLAKTCNVTLPGCSADNLTQSWSRFKCSGLIQ